MWWTCIAIRQQRVGVHVCVERAIVVAHPNILDVAVVKSVSITMTSHLPRLRARTFFASARASFAWAALRAEG